MVGQPAGWRYCEINVAWTTLLSWPVCLISGQMKVFFSFYVHCLEPVLEEEVPADGDFLQIQLCSPHELPMFHQLAAALDTGDW